jgi:hypothetical protein
VLDGNGRVRRAQADIEAKKAAAPPTKREKLLFL